MELSLYVDSGEVWFTSDWWGWHHTRAVGLWACGTCAVKRRWLPLAGSTLLLRLSLSTATSGYSSMSTRDSAARREHVESLVRW